MCLTARLTAECEGIRGIRGLESSVIASGMTEGLARLSLLLLFQSGGPRLELPDAANLKSKRSNQHKDGGGGAVWRAKHGGEGETH